MSDPHPMLEENAPWALASDASAPSHFTNAPRATLGDSNVGVVSPDEFERLMLAIAADLEIT